MLVWLGIFWLFIARSHQILVWLAFSDSSLQEAIRCQLVWLGIFWLLFLLSPVWKFLIHLWNVLLSLHSFQSRKLSNRACSASESSEQNEIISQTNLLPPNGRAQHFCGRDPAGWHTVWCVDSLQYQKLGKSKNGNSVFFSSKTCIVDKFWHLCSHLTFCQNWWTLYYFHGKNWIFFFWIFLFSDVAGFLLSLLCNFPAAVSETPGASANFTPDRILRGLYLSLRNSALPLFPAWHSLWWRNASVVLQWMHWKWEKINPSGFSIKTGESVKEENPLLRTLRCVVFRRPQRGFFLTGGDCRVIKLETEFGD